MLKERFIEHVHSTMPEITRKKLIVAVSGGVDSMVLLYLLKEIHADVLVAHCNFHLRGEESDADAAFVRDYCVRNKLDVEIKDFDPEVIKAGSVQTTARNLRYEWFDELSRSENALILTAHQEDDLIETFFINLTRGAGLKGLSGIPSVRNNIRRPLLVFSRRQIEQYAAVNDIKFRVDRSNASNKYLRNHIRNKVLPLLREIEPNFNNQINQSIQFISDAASSWQNLSEKSFGKLIEGMGQRMEIDLKGFDKTDQWMLTEQLIELGFSSDQIRKLFSNLEHSGRFFKSHKAQLLVDRSKLIIYPIGIQDFNDWEVGFSKDDVSVGLPYGNLLIRSVDRVSVNEELKNKDNVLFLDKVKVPSNLQVRNWRKGDVFSPLGLAGTKKLSDFFIDRKISVDMKHRLPVIESNGNIIAICGLEIADGYKLDNNAQACLRLEVKYDKQAI